MLLAYLGASATVALFKPFRARDAVTHSHSAPPERLARVLIEYGVRARSSRFSPGFRGLHARVICVIWQPRSRLFEAVTSTAPRSPIARGNDRPLRFTSRNASLEPEARTGRRGALDPASRTHGSLGSCSRSLHPLARKSTPKALPFRDSISDHQPQEAFSNTFIGE